jgi:hypothetical protein
MNQQNSPAKEVSSRNPFYPGASNHLRRPKIDLLAL